MELSKLSPLELVEQLQQYPAETHPEEHARIRTEIKSRKQQLAQENDAQSIKDDDRKPADIWKEGLKKKELYSLVMFVVVVATQVFSILFANRDLVLILILIPVLSATYYDNVYRLKQLQKDATVWGQISEAKSPQEIALLTKPKFWQRLIVLGAYAVATGIGYFYFLVP